VQIREKLARRAAKAGLTLSEATFSGLEAYFELLRKWNQRVSLTSLRVDQCDDEAVDRLLIEPALATRYLPRMNSTVIDIGSGGGSPAIPMKLVAPGIAMLMVESRTRKAAFLREAVRQLGLDRTDVQATRFEELLSKPTLHDSSDAITLRAVKVDAKILAAVQSFLRPGGFVLLFTAVPTADVSPPPQLRPYADHALLQGLGTRLQVLQKISFQG
jgi:16S rRNA (guanine527-N7)-methyltransferase